MPNGLVNRLSVICLLLLTGVIYGCAGMEYAPKKQIWYYHKELPAAERAVEAARAAGKDKECPAEFAAAEKMKNDAYETYWACHTEEGIAMAKEATARANALCPKKAMAPPPPPPPSPVVEPLPLPAPIVSLSANPASVVEGKCSTLNWSSSDVTEVTIDQGIGTVAPNGSRQVCPQVTTPYTITATGAGGSRTAATTVTVTPGVIDRLTLHVNFDFDKSDVRKADVAELQKAIDFVKKYPGYKIAIEGHTDSRGSDKYNQALSDRRAAAVKDYLLKHGMIDTHKDMIMTKGYGESKPIADNSTEKGRFENRRVEILVLSE